jgi:hypothetical protein
MTMITLKIWDDGDELKMEATMDNPEAINEMPTAALIFGSYLGANTASVVADAMHWFKQQVTAVEEEQQIVMPRDKEIKL